MKFILKDWWKKFLLFWWPWYQ